MPTNTYFELIYLGTAADVDVVESGDGSVAENASDLLGTYGSAGSPLYLQQFSAYALDGNDDGLIVEDGEGGSGIDYLVVDVGGTPNAYTVDSTIGFLGSITYADGSSESGGLGVLQDTAGNLWLIPVAGGGLSSFNTKGIESITLTTVALDNGGSYAPASSSGLGFVCFARGTLIETPAGPVAVEDLQPGTLVTTLDFGPQALLWRGTRVLDFSDGAASAHKPVEIKAGALGAQTPRETLLLSPQHRVALPRGPELVLAPAKALLHRPGIRSRKGQRQIEYHSLLFARHQILFANGCPVESLYPGVHALRLLSPHDRRAIHACLPRLTARAATSYGPMARVALSVREARAALDGMPEQV